MKRETKGRGSLRGMALWSLLIIGVGKICAVEPRPDE